MNNEIITMITCFVTNVVVSIFTIISDLLMNCHNYKPVKGSHNLKFIKLYFKYFIKEYGPGIPGMINMMESTIILLTKLRKKQLIFRRTILIG